ncbi:MAG: S-layer homology domain-containing protein, partial [Clostridia bacterium]|nr:S-layer homology domain-containing protein [Clostridia bacterium]
QKDETQYMLLASALLDEYVLEKFDKINCYINAENQKIYLGQVAEIDFVSSSELEDVKEINIVISCDDADALKNAEYESAKGTNAVSSYSNGKLNVKITSDAEKIKELGTLKIEGINVGTIEFAASGKVVYDLETLYDVVSVLNEKSFAVNVTKNTNKDTGGSSGGSGGSSSSGLGGIKEEVKTEKFEFKDIDSVAWAKDSIEYLLNYGVISESDDANFRPNDSVKREEFVKMIVVALGVYDSKATTDLKDVDSSKWCYQYVASAQKLGLVKGNDKGAFGVGEEITREDMAVIISRALEILGFENDGVNSEIFADDAQISGYAKDAVYMMKELGLINGMGDGNFAPKSTATRAQTAKMIFEMMKAVGK